LEGAGEAEIGAKPGLFQQYPVYSANIHASPLIANGKTNRYDRGQRVSGEKSTPVRRVRVSPRHGEEYSRLTGSE